MVLVKILGGIDLASALAFLLLAFGLSVFTPFIVFCASLLLLKSMFILSGELLSIIDLISAILLLTSLLITLPAILIWFPAFFLLAKGVISFV